ncbi:LysR substrate-binding domain-containing protein, partial [Streptomyces sp. NPDC127079]
VLCHPLDDVFDWDAPPGEPAFERPATTEDAVELVAAGVGLLVVPQSLARLYHRRDLTYRPLTDGPRSTVALSWPEEATTDLVEDFIGIVRGRTVNSSRGRQQAPEKQQKPERAERSQKPAQAKAAQAGRGTPRSRGTGAKRAQSAKPAKRAKPRRRS